MLDAYFYDLSLRKAMDAAGFFSLVDLSFFSSTCDCLFFVGCLSITVIYRLCGLSNFG